MTPEELGAALHEVLDRAAIGGLRRLSGGASRQTWAFEADGCPLILQRERPAGLRAGGGMANEAALLRAAAEAGVPVAAVVADDGGAGALSALGAPFLIMERVPGETIPRKLLRDEVYAPVRPGLARQCGAILAAVHRIDPACAPGLEEPDQLNQFEEFLDLLGEPHPALELGLRWLRLHPPGHTRGAGVVHGDFRTGNLIVGPHGVGAVLDWELAHLGDPAEDLGWFCVRAWRFGSPQPAGGFGTREELLAGYAEAGGAAVDLDDLLWWETMGTIKWGVMCIVQARTHLDGVARSVELASIGRRVCENELDVLDLLDRRP